MLWPKDVSDRLEAMEAIEHDTRPTTFDDAAGTAPEQGTVEDRRRARQDENRVRAALYQRTGAVAAAPVRPPTESAGVEGSHPAHDDDHKGSSHADRT